MCGTNKCVISDPQSGACRMINTFANMDGVCIYSTLCVWCVMFSLMGAFKRACAFLFCTGVSTSKEPVKPARPPFTTEHTFPIILPPPPSVALIPDFNFRPSDSLLAAMGEGVEFVVANPLDLVLQGQNLMANVLVVEVKSPVAAPSMLWFRFNPDSIVARGISACRLVSDDELVGDGGLGVCGWVIDRKRM